MKLTDEMLKSIAEDLECGLKVYVHVDTLVIKSIPDFENNEYAEEEGWEEDIKELEDNYDKYFAFERMSSNESFQVMEDFVETVEDEELQKKLELGLSLSKPFRNFKDIIDNSDYRQQWFAFRDVKYIEKVKEQLNQYNEMNEKT